MYVTGRGIRVASAFGTGLLSLTTVGGCPETVTSSEDNFSSPAEAPLVREDRDFTVTAPLRAACPGVTDETLRAELFLFAIDVDVNGFSRAELLAKIDDLTCANPDGTSDTTCVQCFTAIVDQTFFGPTPFPTP